MSVLEYSYRLRHSYDEYLNQQYFKENMNVVVAKNVREAVGSIEDIYKNSNGRIDAGIAGIQYSVDQTNDNLESMSFQLEKIESTLDVVNANIVSGFQSLFVKLDELDGSLAHIGRGIDTLVEIARTPVQTWSFNQFEIARDAVRRKLFPEALEALDLAINGNEHSPGYKADYRFHQLRGVLLLGIPGEPDTRELVDLNSAEQSFLLAARYAYHDNKTQAAQALVGAGKAAYAKGDLPTAHKYYLDALKSDPQCGEANFQMARLSIDANAKDALRHFLCEAFNIHWSFAMRAASDAQFSHASALVEGCVHETVERIEKKLMPTLEASKSQLGVLLKNEDDTITISKVDEFKKARAEIASLMGKTEYKKLKNITEVRTELSKVPDKLKGIASDYCRQLKSHEDVIVARGTGRKIYSESADAIGSKAAAWVFVIGALGWALYCWLFMTSDNGQPGRIGSFAIAITFVFWFLAGGIAVIIPLLGITFGLRWLTIQFVNNMINTERHREQLKNEAVRAANRSAMNNRIAEIKTAFCLS